MSDVPSNLIPTRVTQLPIAPVADENSLMMIVYQGNNYQIRVGDLLSVAGVPTSRQVIAGTGLSGGGQLANNVTLSVAVGGIGNTQLAATGVAAGTYGDATNIPVFTVDAKGRIQAATTIPAQISGYVPVTRQVIAGTGLTGGGPLNANVTLGANLSNSTPLATDGLGTPGTSTAISRADHQHPSVNLQNSSEIDGVLGLSNGGTAKSIVPNEGALIWCGADGLYVGPVGTAGQVLQSTGIGEYIWVDQGTLDVGQADNLNGGAANRIAYQTGVGVTGFISAPTVTDTFLKWNGSQLIWGALPGGGTVTSVGLTLPTGEFSVSGSPVTTSGTLTGAWKTQLANVVFAGPNTGSAAAPAFRSLVADDLPSSGVTAGSYGGASKTLSASVNAQGQVTDLSEETIEISHTQVSGLGTAAVLDAGMAGGVATLDGSGKVPVSELPAAVLGTLSYQGTWNASTNTPTLASSVGTKGYYYVVSVAGNTNLNGITDWQIGDWAVYSGTAWQKLDNTDSVTSVNGYTGAVTLTYSDVGAPSTSGTNATGTWNIGISGNAATATTAGSVTNSVTFNSSGTGGASPQTFNGSGAVTVSRNTLGAAASGANGDITSMSGLTGAIGTPNYVAFNTSYNTTLSAGQLGWDGNNTLGLGMAGGNVVQRIGEDEFYYIKASSAITKGQVVMFTGSVGASGVVTGAPATGVTEGSYIMGIAAESMSLNAFGLVQFQGTLRGVDTSAFTDGAILWYNPAVTGGLTATKPSAPNVKVQMAAVIYASNGASGSILIRVSPGSVLGGTDSNVEFSTLANGNLIQYNSTAGYWQNVTPGSVTGVGSVANAITFNSSGGAVPGTTFNGSAARTVDYSTVGAPKADGTGASGTWSIAISGNAATATSLAGGAASQIPYQSGSGTTSFLANGTAGQVLTSAGASAPTWGGINGGTF